MKTLVLPAELAGESARPTLVQVGQALSPANRFFPIIDILLILADSADEAAYVPAV